MRVDLPGGEYATLKERHEISERSARRIRSALRGALGQAGRLAEKGFDENDPSTWGVVNEDAARDEPTDIEVYQDRCIVELVKVWTLGDLPTMDTVQDLPSATYSALAEAATSSFGDETEYGADGAVDPKAGIGDSDDSPPTSSAVV